MVERDTYIDDIKAYADGELNPLRRTIVGLHLMRCASCRKELAEMQQLASDIHGLSEDQKKPLDDALRSKILADYDRIVATDKYAPAPVRQYRWREAVAAMAVIGFAVFVYNTFHQNPTMTAGLQHESASQGLQESAAKKSVIPKLDSKSSNQPRMAQVPSVANDGHGITMFNTSGSSNAIPEKMPVHINRSAKSELDVPVAPQPDKSVVYKPDTNHSFSKPQSVATPVTSDQAKLYDMHEGQPNRTITAAPPTTSAAKPDNMALAKPSYQYGIPGGAVSANGTSINSGDSPVTTNGYNTRTDHTDGILGTRSTGVESNGLRGPEGGFKAATISPAAPASISQGGIGGGYAESQTFAMSGANRARRIHKEASVTIAVDNPDDKSNKIAGIVKAEGGYLNSNNLGIVKGLHTSQITVTLPAAKFESVMAQISQLGVVRTKTITGDDLTDKITTESKRAAGLQVKVKNSDDRRVNIDGSSTADKDKGTSRQMHSQLEKTQDNLQYDLKLSDLATITITLTEAPQNTPASK